MRNNDFSGERAWVLLRTATAPFSEEENAKRLNDLELECIGRGMRPVGYTSVIGPERKSYFGHSFFSAAEEVVDRALDDDYDVLVVQSVSQIGYSVYDILRLSHEICDVGKSILFLDEDIILAPEELGGPRAKPSAGQLFVDAFMGLKMDYEGRHYSGAKRRQRMAQRVM